MITQKTINHAVQLLVEAAQPNKVILFGSYASNDAGEDSDKEGCYMKQPIDLARQFLAVADNDIKAFQRLGADADIADASVGFHAQQAVEKWAGEQVQNAGS